MKAAGSSYHVRTSDSFGSRIISYISQLFCSYCSLRQQNLAICGGTGMIKRQIRTRLQSARVNLSAVRLRIANWVRGFATIFCTLVSENCCLIFTTSILNTISMNIYSAIQITISCEVVFDSNLHTSIVLYVKWNDNMGIVTGITGILGKHSTHVHYFDGRVIIGSGESLQYQSICGKTKKVMVITHINLAISFPVGSFRSMM